MKSLQKTSKFLSDYTSVVVILIAVVTFFIPGMMGWVNYQLFTDPVANKFTSQSIIIGVIMFSMGLTLTTKDCVLSTRIPKNQKENSLFSEAEFPSFGRTLLVV